MKGKIGKNCDGVFKRYTFLLPYLTSPYSFPLVVLSLFLSVLTAESSAPRPSQFHFPQSLTQFSASYEYR